MIDRQPQIPAELQGMANNVPARVCIVNEGGAFGGAEVHTLQLAKLLASRGHAVDVIDCGEPVMARHSPSLVADFGIRFHAVPLSTDANSLPDMYRWFRLLGKLAPTHGILVKNWFERGSMPFLLAMRAACAHVSLIEHLEALPAPAKDPRRYFGVIPRPGLWRLRDGIRRKFPSLIASDVIAVSGKVASTLVSDCGYDSRKVHVARNGVEHARFARNDASGAEFRDSLGIPRDRCLVTILARLEYAKGIDLALRAMSEIEPAQGGRPIHLLIAGTGVLESELKTLAQTLNVTERVTFSGFLSNPKPALWASDGILFSSRLEGLPLGLLEGMAAGCLPVVTRVSGMPEVVTDASLGWVVEPEDPAALALALQELASLDQLALAGYRERVVAHILGNFDLGQALQRLAGFLAL